MRFISFTVDGHRGIASSTDVFRYNGLTSACADYPGALIDLLRKGEEALSHAAAVLERGEPIDIEKVTLVPPIWNPEKIVCVGLNYADHSTESGFKVPDYPAIFDRFPSSLVGHGAPLVRPRVSTQFDYEGELVAIIGRRGRHISEVTALHYVAGYSVFNDVSVRDYQFKSTQWTIGKNFDGTGAFGPAFVSADELPVGAKGLRLETRVNGTVVQSASTTDMLFDVAKLIALISEAITLVPGDLIVTGTPAGVGFARKPQLFLKPGDLCEVDIEGVGTLSNPVIEEGGAH